jgi:iron complex transport system ATP-binding protein
MSDPKLLEIRNATIWRGTTCVFENLTLDIEQHERVAILGPNGSGKTTLLKTIDRELYPVAKADSTIRILGKDRWNVWQLRKRIGVVSNDLQQRYTASTISIAFAVSPATAAISLS